jgi:hypothetical protein
MGVVERAVQQRLPEDYREFARVGSVGTPDESDFSFADDGGTFYAAVGVVLNFDPEDDAKHRVLSVGSVSIAEDGGGNLICLDYGHSLAPSIVFWHHGRCGPDEISFVCRTFTDFLDALHEPRDDDEGDDDDAAARQSAVVGTRHVRAGQAATAGAAGAVARSGRDGRR